MWACLVGSALFLGLVTSVEVRQITAEECEDAEFHLDPDDCPASYFRCTPDGKVRVPTMYRRNFLNMQFFQIIHLNLEGEKPRRFGLIAHTI